MLNGLFWGPGPYSGERVPILGTGSLFSGTDTEFYVPDLWSQDAIMAKNRAVLLNLDLFWTTFPDF